METLSPKPEAGLGPASLGKLVPTEDARNLANGFGLRVQGSTCSTSKGFVVKSYKRPKTFAPARNIVADIILFSLSLSLSVSLSLCLSLSLSLSVSLSLSLSLSVSLRGGLEGRQGRRGRGGEGPKATPHSRAEIGGLLLAIFHPQASKATPT